MRTFQVQPPCQAGLSRRSFLAGCAAGAVCAACPAAGQAVPETAGKAKVRLVFSYPPPDKEGWPYVNYDYETRKKQILARLEPACPATSFLPAAAHNDVDAKRILEADREVDGYVVYMLGIPAGVAPAFMDSGRPVILVDDLYGGTGHFLTSYATARRKGLKVAGVSSSRFEDVASAARSFETLKKLRTSAIVDVRERPAGAMPKAIEEAFGTKVTQVTGTELDEAYRGADRADARRWAGTWVRNAAKVIEPSREEIDKSGAMYLAMREVMQRHKAQALAIDCLNLFYGGRLAAYPCLGLCQFNDDGLVGACESDLMSTITMLLMTYLVQRPGFISDPVIDTSKNQIIYAHCVAPTKVYGPAGPRTPYHIRDHSEDRKGASLRSLLPLGEMTTTLEISPARREIVFHQAKTVANLDEDRACRTKLAAEVKDPYKLLSEWDRWGWHRVTYYGDLRVPLETVGTLLGFQMIHEG